MINIEDDGVPNTVSIDNGAHTAAITHKAQRATTSVQTELDPNKDGTPRRAYEKNTSKDEYVVKPTVWHVVERNKYRYVVVRR